jgi:hypothetical protein
MSLISRGMLATLRCTSTALCAQAPHFKHALPLPKHVFSSCAASDVTRPVTYVLVLTARHPQLVTKCYICCHVSLDTANISRNSGFFRIILLLLKYTLYHLPALGYGRHK